MKKYRFFHNFGLKILAVLISILLWLTVINVSDPVINTTYSDIPVVITNAESVTSEGKVYELTSASTVTIAVSAKRSILDYLNEDNFKAVVDLENYNEGTGTVPIRVETNRHSDKIESMKSRTEYATVNIDDMLSKQFVITPIVLGEPEDGYVTGEVSTAENIVRISGAESVVSTIKKVTAEVSVSGLSSKVNTSVDLKLYDEQGELVQDKNLTKNISTVAMSVQILATKELPLRFSASGVPKEGYSISGPVTADRDSIVVAGKATSLANLNAIDISSAAVSVDEADRDLTVEVDLTRYLPDGISLVDEESTKLVTVKVPIDAIVTKVFEIAKEEIQMLGLPEMYEVEFVTDAESLSLEVEGVSGIMASVTQDDVKLAIDWDKYVKDQKMEALSEGTYRVPVVVNLPDGVRKTRDILISVRLNEVEAE